MMLWPAVTLLGFLLLTAVVIGLGAQTTARYEREHRAERPSGTRHAAEPGRACRAARPVQALCPFPERGAVGFQHRPGERLEQVELRVHARQFAPPEVPRRLPLPLVE